MRLRVQNPDSMLMTRLLILASFLGPAYSWAAPGNKAFWIWNGSQTAPKFRLAQTRLLASGQRTDIYVEHPHSRSPAQLQNLVEQIENLSLPGALVPGLGVLPLGERLFGPLPGSGRLSVVIGRLRYTRSFSTPLDRGLAPKPWKSNFGNIIYVDVNAKESESALVAHELRHLLAPSHRAPLRPGQWDWLEEVLAEAMMLATGHYDDQHLADALGEKTGNAPLVSRSYLPLGPQLLFASFLIDSFPDPERTLRELGGLADSRRETLAAYFRQRSNYPTSFDLIYGNFLSYLFSREGSSTLPNSLVPEGQTGLRVPRMRPFAAIASLPSSVEGSILPYSFVVLSLAEPLPATAVVEVTSLKKEDNAGCTESSLPLWKPVNPTKIVVYAVGCEHRIPADRVEFRLRILERS